MPQQALATKGPVHRSSTLWGGSAAGGIGPLMLTLTRPAGYTEAEAATKGWVTWGVVGGVVVGNIAESFALATGEKVYVKAITDGEVPLRVMSAEIEVVNAGVTPEDLGGTISTPPTTAYYLLGQVWGAGTVESPFFVTNVSATGGSLALSVRAVGYSCVLATPGDPAATPPVPPTTGGVKTDYELKWERVP